MFETEDTVFILCKPFYVVLKAFGLACYSFDKKTRKLKVTYYEKLILVAMVCLWIFLIKIQFSTKFSVDYKNVVDSTLLDNLWLHQYLIQHIFGLIAIVHNFFHRKKIEDLFKIISNFDQKAASYNIRIQGKIFRNAVISVVVSVFLLTLYGIIFGIDNNFSIRYSPVIIFFYCANYCFVLLFYVVLTEQFVISAFCVRARLVALNNKLSQSFDSHYQPIKESIIVGAAANLFDLLADAVDVINEVFSRQMIAIIVSSVLLEIITAYFVIKFFVFNLVMNLMTFIDFVVWVIFLIIPKFVAIYASSSCSKEAKKLNIMVDKQISNCHNRALFQKLKTLSSKIKLRTISFNCGLFNIDWKLALSIFGTIATYMIIIFQFEKDLGA